MKIDPLTGKAYRHEWERDLNRIWKAGYSYGYLSWVNPQTDEAVYQADAIKGDGPRAIGRGNDMAEAVVCRDYSDARSKLAKERGLGEKGGKRGLQHTTMMNPNLI